MLEDLESRWRDERTPQAGVRLAKTLLQQGDRARAEGILEEVDSRLGSDPRDLASRVAVGGLRLALGQPAEAARVLEEVVAADATHLKANKLLVEVYLDLDQRDRARDRLDLYRLLNEGDPEIESLEGLLVGVVVPEVPPAAGVAVAPAAERRLNVAGGDPFAALVAEPAPIAGGDLFAGLAPPPTPPTATATLGALYQEQGHREDAERVFREVIAREPDNLPAREALAALAEGLAPAPAEEPDLALVEGPEPAPAEEVEPPSAEPSPVEQLEAQSAEPVPAEEVEPLSAEPSPVEQPEAQSAEPAPAEEVVPPSAEPSPVEQFEAPSAEPSLAEELEALAAELPVAEEPEPAPAELSLAEEPAPEPVVAAPQPVLDDPEADRQRRIGVLRDYLERIQRGREVIAR